MKKGVDYIGVGVGALIVNKEGKLFLAMRGKETRNESGKWEFSGAVNHGFLSGINAVKSDGFRWRRSKQ